MYVFPAKRNKKIIEGGVSVNLNQFQLEYNSNASCKRERVCIPTGTTKEQTKERRNVPLVVHLREQQQEHRGKRRTVDTRAANCAGEYFHSRMDTPHPSVPNFLLLILNRSGRGNDEQYIIRCDIDTHR